MADEGDLIETLLVHQRDEVGRVDRDAGRPLNLPRRAPAPQVRREEPPARKPLRRQLVGEGAEGVGASG